jgi:hypothetical protein
MVNGQDINSETRKPGKGKSQQARKGMNQETGTQETARALNKYSGEARCAERGTPAEGNRRHRSSSRCRFEIQFPGFVLS